MTSLHPIVQTVNAYIRLHSLLDKHSLYLVALSGGADSVSLLRILCSLGYRVEAMHCNFRLRGAESDRDERFSRQLCEKLGVSFHIIHFDTREYAALHKVSIEMAARNLRYAYFERLRQDLGAKGICVAHHREDSVETVLINLVRGTGLHGLCGIRPVQGHIIRPLLCVDRQDIESYLDHLHQDYVTDSTNLENNVVRNKIRLDVMPLLRAINPSVDISISHTAERMADAAKVFDAAMADACTQVVEQRNGLVAVSLARLLSHPSPEYLLFSILKPYGFLSSQVETIYSRLTAPTGKLFSSSEYDAVLDRGYLLVGKRTQPVQPIRLPEEGIYVYGTDRKIKVESKSVGSGFVVSRLATVATVDASAVRFPLVLRPWRQGDRWIPFGMKGSKLVSDYLTDRKRNAFERRRQLVVTDADDKVIWLVGERIDNRVRISDTTSRVWVLTLLAQDK